MIQNSQPPPSPTPNRVGGINSLKKNKKKIKENEGSPFSRVNMCVQVTSVAINTSFQNSWLISLASPLGFSFTIVNKNHKLKQN